MRPRPFVRLACHVLRSAAIVPVALTILQPSPASADDFDRFDGRVLTGALRGAGAKAHEVLTLAELGRLPATLKGTRTPLIVVKTDQGNPARLLASQALRKPSGGQGEPVPILVLDRFETFEAGPATTRLARGKDVLLFDGYRYDLDTGQVVPEGQGGDIRFVAKAEGGPRLEATGGAKLFTFEKPLAVPAADEGKPSAGRNVVPGDFSGRYRLVANGQWSGSLDWKADEHGVVTGRFRSDQTGSSYHVTGQVVLDSPRRIHFAVELPQTRQEYDGYLFSEGKAAIAGTVSLLEQTYGFVAIREGGHLSPDGAEGK